MILYYSTSTRESQYKNPFSDVRFIDKLRKEE